MRRLTAFVPGLVLVLVLVVPLAAPRPAEAQFAVVDLVNWVENALQVIQQIYEIYQRYEQLVNDIERYKTMVKNLERFDELTFRNLVGLTKAVNDLIQEGKSLGHTLDDIDTQFAETFPGYGHLLTEDWEEVYEEKTARTLDTLRTVLNAVHRVSWSSIPSQDMLARLAQDVEDAEGNMEALQAQSELLHHQSTELGKLNQQVSLLANVQTVFSAYELDREASAQATALQWIRNGVRRVPEYDAAGGLRGVPRSWSCPACGF